MSGSSAELLDLVARWVHVVAGIMWVGNSLLFNWLDRSLVSAPERPQTSKPTGTIWLLHSGGFYYVEKTLLDGERLPVPLHWFKWQAYTTWLSGMALLIVVYYAGGRAVLGDFSSGISHRDAVLLSVGSIAAGWAIYESMNRFVAPRAPSVAAVIWIAGLVAISLVLLRCLDGRAAFLHVGALLGTIMAANVFWTIVPSQRELVASVDRGEGGDPKVSARAKRVSIHNNYFTFPVIALMVSNHFPVLYGGRWSWLVLVILVLGGAGVRHVLNLRWTWPAWRLALAAVIAATILGLWIAANVGARSAMPSSVMPAGPVTFAEVRHVIDTRCAVCHSARPTDASFGASPGGVAFDTPAQITARAARISERAVLTRTMPPGNKTAISEAERALLGAWVEQGATVR